MTDFELAAKYLPYFFADEREPFPIRRIGYAILRESGASPSFDREMQLPPNAAFAIEYAVFWDYDIQHLYDLEHVWVYVGSQGEMLDAESSTHGRVINCFRLAAPPIGETHLPLYLQPGKHAVFPQGNLPLLYPNYADVCDALAGKDGVLVPKMFRPDIPKPAGIDEAAVAYIRKRFAFRPTLSYRPALCDASALLPMARLLAEVPTRINALIREISSTSC